MIDFINYLINGALVGLLYALIAMGFVVIYRASKVFNFAQGIMVVFAALTLVGLYQKGVPVILALILSMAFMGILALAVERFIMRPLVNQPHVILLMATIGTVTINHFLYSRSLISWSGSANSSSAASRSR